MIKGAKSGRPARLTKIKEGMIMSSWQGTVLSDEELMSWHLKPLESRQAIARIQAERSFKMGQEDEKAKVKAIYKDANDLKELEDRIREYLEGERECSNT